MLRAQGELLIKAITVFMAEGNDRITCNLLD